MPKKGNSKKKIVKDVEKLVKDTVATGGPSAKTLRNRARRRKQRVVSGMASGRHENGWKEAGLSQRPKDNTVRSRFQKFDLSKATASGEAWLRLAMNPCDDASISVGYPDMETAPVVTPHEREKMSISFNDTPDSTMTTGTKQDDLPYNILLVSDPTTLTVWYLIYQGSIEAPSYAAWFSKVIRLKEHVDEANFAASRVVGYGTTVEFTGATLTDQGEQVCAQLKSAWKEAKEFSTSAAQTPPQAGRQYEAWPLNDGPLTTATPDDLKGFTEELMEADPQSNGGKAKIGAYFIHKMNTPTLELKQHNFSAVDGDLRYMINPFTTAYVNLPTDSATLTAPNLVRVVNEGLYGWNAAIYWATGLAVSTTYAVKMYAYVEMQLQPKSPMRFYAHKPPRYDPEAQVQYNKMAEEMPSSFPSAANAFGWLKKAFNWVKGAFGKAKDVYNIAKPIYDMIPK